MKNLKQISEIEMEQLARKAYKDIENKNSTWPIFYACFKEMYKYQNTEYDDFNG